MKIQSSNIDMVENWYIRKAKDNLINFLIPIFGKSKIIVSMYLTLPNYNQATTTFKNDDEKFMLIAIIDIRIIPFCL